MGEKTILVGCCEPPVTEAIKVLIAGRCHVTECSRMDEFVGEAVTGECDSVVLCPNSISPPLLLDGGLLENAVAAIKSIKGARWVSVIILSTMPSWRDPLLAAGVDAFVPMPVDSTAFRAALDHLSR
jgi:hypothetical protein